MAPRHGAPWPGEGRNPSTSIISDGSGRSCNLSIPRVFIKASVASALTRHVFTASAFGQSPAACQTAQRRFGTRPCRPRPGRSTVPPRSRHPLPRHRPTNDRYRDGIVIWETPARRAGALPAEVQRQYPAPISQHPGYRRRPSPTTWACPATCMLATTSRSIARCSSWAATSSTRGRDTVSPSGRPPAPRRSSSPATLAGNSTRPSRSLAGYTGVPGSRSLVNTFPFFTATDRSMADNFFRPGFTQGVWANGEPVKGLNYLAFVGNGLNTLNISANKIDTHLLLSGSVWWEPLGPYGEPGKSRNMYDDYFASGRRSRSTRHGVYEIPGGPVFKSRSIKSREHVAVQLRRRADLLDRSVCARCHGRPGHVQDVGD